MSKLYLISPPQIELPKFIEQFKQAVGDGGVSAFQLRLKDISDSEILRAAESLLPVCQNFQIPLIINDSPEITKKSGADGVHLGSEDGNWKAAREIIGNNAVMGISCYNSIDIAIGAAQAGADYVSFGAFYPTTTKVAKSKAEISTLEKWVMTTQVPCSVIGGITPENAKPLVKAGADFICVISYVWNHSVSPAEAVKEFQKVLA